MNAAHSTNLKTLLEQAICNLQKVEIKYQNSSGLMTERKISPLAMYCTIEGWFVMAECSLRKEARLFRLDRIKSINMLDDYFAPQTSALERFFQKEA
jgi:predicted DNA-binding transcriptional regulator YafY